MYGASTSQGYPQWTSWIKTWEGVPRLNKIFLLRYHTAKMELSDKKLSMVQTCVTLTVSLMSILCLQRTSTRTQMASAATYILFQWKLLQIWSSLKRNFIFKGYSRMFTSSGVHERVLHSEDLRWIHFGVMKCMEHLKVVKISWYHVLNFYPLIWKTKYMVYAAFQHSWPWVFARMFIAKRPGLSIARAVINAACYTEARGLQRSRAWLSCLRLSLPLAFNSNWIQLWHIFRVCLVSISLNVLHNPKTTRLYSWNYCTYSEFTFSA